MGPPAGSKGVRQSAGSTGGPETLRIKLLGGFSVSVGSRTIQQNAWRLRKSAALVKLLALAPRYRQDVLPGSHSVAAGTSPSSSHTG